MQPGPRSAAWQAAAQKGNALTESSAGQTDHKFVIVLNKKIDPGNALNACGHMMATLVAYADQIRTARLEAIRAGLPCADFTETMTRDTVLEQIDRTRAIREQALNYWGICLFGRKDILDPITRKFSLWRI